MGKSPPPADSKRHYIMSRIKSKNTSIELSLRKALWRSGIKYRKNYAKLPGTPDIAITKYQIAIFCDGDFWHGKDWKTKKPRIKSNREYWFKKIERNITRDNETNRLLRGMGWTVVRFWGTEICGNPGNCIDNIKEAIFQNQVDAGDVWFGSDEP
ncbi:MAG: very short patch repair endonuclease [Acidaminococcales bacterium]|jgi:DNA mismatch endonuclease (patch repair protein)|nr:very short patch repair endonuclease [Acidaminococcales bacterium]